MEEVAGDDGVGGGGVKFGPGEGEGGRGYFAHCELVNIETL